MIAEDIKNKTQEFVLDSFELNISTICAISGSRINEPYSKAGLAKGHTSATSLLSYLGKILLSTFHNKLENAHIIILLA